MNSGSPDKSLERIKMTKRAVLCPWQSDQKSGSISDGHETASDYLTSSSLYILLWGRCRRDLSTTLRPYNACDRNYHFMRRFACVPGKFIGVPSVFFFCVRRLIAAPYFAFIAFNRRYPSARALGAYRKNRTWGKGDSYKAPCMQDRKHESFAWSRRDHPLRSFPSSLYDDMKIFSWLAELGTQTLSSSI